MLGIRLPADIEKRLAALAKKTGRTKTYYARMAILEHLEDMEDTYLAEKRLNDLRAGKERLWTQEDLEAGRDLED